MRGEIWRGVPGFHRPILNSWPRRLQTEYPYWCHVCERQSYKLWVCDDATWKLLPARFQKLRLCLRHFKMMVAKHWQYHPRKLEDKKAVIEARYQQLKRAGKYKRINYGARKSLVASMNKRTRR